MIKKSLANFEFESGHLIVTEADNKRPAALHLFKSAKNMQILDRGGLELADYCPCCQTKTKLLADRPLSRLLKKDRPKTIEALVEIERVNKNTKL